MKLTLALLALTIMTGCAVRPPWQRMTPTHEPLMIVPTPNPNWP